MAEKFGEPLSRSFYARDARETARALLNCVLIYENAEGVCAGRIAETEAYLRDDPASHASRGRTQRNAVMFGPPGRAYVYFTYGMHYCFNVVTGEEGVGEAALIRALEPLVGLEQMRARRGLTEELGRTDDKARIRLGRALCGGPGKLCQAFGLTLAQNGLDLTTGETLWIAPPPPEFGAPDPRRILATPRIGISVAKEELWRYTLRDDPFTSR